MNEVIARLKRQIKYLLDTGDYVGAKNQLNKLITFIDYDVEITVEELECTE